MNRDLFAEATLVLSRLLKQASIQHVIIGGQAGRMLGSERLTEDVDVLVSCPGVEARTAVATRDTRFVLINHQMAFQTEVASIHIEFLQGGMDAALKMPEVTNLPIVEINFVPILHPSVLVWLKIRRWMHIAESTRPQSIAKADKDVKDIEFLLQWLAQNGKQIDFRGLDNQRVASLLEGIRLFRTKFPLVEQNLRLALPT